MRYVDGLCRRVERRGRKERSGQCLCHMVSSKRLKSDRLGTFEKSFPKRAVGQEQ